MFSFQIFNQEKTATYRIQIAYPYTYNQLETKTMKQLVTLFFSIIIAATLVNQTNAQEIHLGGGLAYGTEIEQIGFKAEAGYAFTDEIRGSVDFIYYLPEDLGGGADFKWMEFNFNAHYLFLQEDELNVYGLAGLNFARLSVDIPGVNIPGVGVIGGGESSSTEFGLNIGAGLEYDLGFARLAAELKYAISDADQLVIAAGLRFPI